MAQARREDEWSRCSSLLALIYNRHRGPDEPPLSPNDLNPLAPPPRAKRRGAGEAGGAQHLGTLSVRQVRGALMGMASKAAQSAGRIKPAKGSISAAKGKP
jgi:hypothetical protein